METVEMEDLKAIKVIGSGATGTVLLVRRLAVDPPLALKAVSKSGTGKGGHDALRRTLLERDILARLGKAAGGDGGGHPFVASLVAQVETERTFALLLEYCPGGDLNALRLRQTERSFSEAALRFYAAEITLALEHLHSLGIVYRDLKPENVLIHASGHIMLTDFDLSTFRAPEEEEQQQHPRSPSAAAPQNPRPRTRIRDLFSRVTRVSPAGRREPEPEQKQKLKLAERKQRRPSEFVGTEEYVSPEMVRGDEHGFAVDWWALGILLYEMLYGRTPFKGATRRQTFFNILVAEPQFLGPPTPLRDLIVRLLNKCPRQRPRAAEIKAHPFFRGLDWRSLHRVSRPPFLPAVSADADVPALDGVRIDDFVEKFQAALAARLGKCPPSPPATSSVNPSHWVDTLPGSGRSCAEAYEVR